jgi:LSD1 subclass zinc finger protein
MICSNCSFPLERLSGAQAKVLCPRCNTWLDIDPNCGGSCFSCHKTLSKEPVSACTETAGEKSNGKNGGVNLFTRLARALSKAAGSIGRKPAP